MDREDPEPFDRLVKSTIGFAISNFSLKFNFV